MRLTNFICACATMSALLVPMTSAAQCSVPHPKFTGTGQVGSINVNPSAGFPSDWVDGMLAGMGQWNTTCAAGPKGPIPEVGVGLSSPVGVTIRYHSGPNDGVFIKDCGTGCGCAKLSMDPNSGTLVSGVIHAFELDKNWRVCDDHEGFFAHEFGHIFGLANSNCGIMGPPPHDGITVSSTDCQTADGMWETPMEGEGKIDPDAPCSDPCPDPNSPLVIDMAGNGIHASGVHYPVSFDVDGDGATDLIGWTTPGTDDAFLWLDLNDNGTVDDGRELFGTATELPDGSRARHGFEALAVFDLVEFGGNGDGVITPDDAIWHDLRLWNDFNRDALSQKEEVRKLNQSKLLALGLDFVESDWVDGALTGHFFQGACVLRRKGARGWSTEVGDVHDLFFPRVLPP